MSYGPQHPVTRGLRILASDIRLNVIAALLKHGPLTAQRLTCELESPAPSVQQAIQTLSREGLIFLQTVDQRNREHWALSPRVRAPADGVLTLEMAGFIITLARAAPRAKE